MRFFAIPLIFATFCTTVDAGEFTSEYTKLDPEKGCVFQKQNEANGKSVAGQYSGLREYPVHFSEGDLRQMVEFEFIGLQTRKWANFGEWNHAGKTIEWRLEDGLPVATILRWFIKNINPDTGSANKKLRGQALVISKVGQPSVFDACVVGYVYARSNGNANALAHKIADNIAHSFRCGLEHPKYYGVRGAYAGSPTGHSN